MKKKVLIIQLKFLGDVILSSLIADNIKKSSDDFQIDFLTYVNSLPLIQGNPNISNIYTTSEKEIKSLLGFLKICKIIRAGKYEYLIDPYSKINTMFLSLLSGAKYKISYLKRAYKTLFYNKMVSLEKKPINNYCTAVLDRLNLSKKLIYNQSELKYKYELYLKNNNLREVIQSNYKDLKPYMVIGVLGSNLKKSYPINYMIELIDFIRINYNGSIIFNYAPNQLKTAIYIYECLSNKDNVYYNLAGKNLKEFLYFLESAEMCITNEGGLTHMAKGLNIPTFSIFSKEVKKINWDTMSYLDIHESVHIDDFYDDNLGVNSKDLKPNLFIDKLQKFILNNGSN